MNSGMNEPGPSNDEYETPDWLFKALDAEFGFNYDGAANAENTKCASWWPNSNPAGDARIFCNPPYSKIGEFVDRALGLTPNLWVFLLPSRTDTDWFKRLSESPCVELRWFRKRIRFCLGGKEADSPRFGSLIAIVRPR